MTKNILRLAFAAFTVMVIVQASAFEQVLKLGHPSPANNATIAHNPIKLPTHNGIFWRETSTGSVRVDWLESDFEEPYPTFFVYTVKEVDEKLNNLDASKVALGLSLEETLGGVRQELLIEINDLSERISGNLALINSEAVSINESDENLIKSLIRSEFEDMISELKSDLKRELIAELAQ